MARVGACAIARAPVFRRPIVTALAVLVPCIPIAGSRALQALRNKCRLRRHSPAVSRPLHLGSEPADSRFGGHFVQGHVDAVGEVHSVRPDGDAHWITVAFPAVLAPFIVRKGSIAVDGISLTVADLREAQFDVMIIPFTWDHTNLRGLRAGDPVNLECDMVGKYVARALELRGVRL